LSRWLPRKSLPQTGGPHLGDPVNKQYHIEGIPRSFVFDRGGKLT
jgi:hypothetical protein